MNLDRLFEWWRRRRARKEAEKLEPTGFENWTFHKHVITDGTHVLWVSSGFGYFRDYDGNHLLKGATWRERRKVWKAYHEEVRRRREKLFDEAKKAAGKPPVTPHHNRISRN